MEKDVTAKYVNCFVCSPVNPFGLRLKNEFIDGKAHMEFVPTQYHAGLNGLMHGGFSLMLIDEVMLNAVDHILHVDAVTLNSSTDFKNPAKIGHRMVCEAWVTKQEGRKIYIDAVVFDADDNNKEIVTSKGLFYQMDMDSFLPKDE